MAKPTLTSYASLARQIEREAIIDYLTPKPTPISINGRVVIMKGLPDDTVRDLQTITAGVYIDGLVTVERSEAGIRLLYDVRHPKKRNALYAITPTLPMLVARIVTEMKTPAGI